MNVCRSSFILLKSDTAIVAHYCLSADYLMTPYSPSTPSAQLPMRPRVSKTLLECESTHPRRYTGPSSCVRQRILTLLLAVLNRSLPDLPCISTLTILYPNILAPPMPDDCREMFRVVH